MHEYFCYAGQHWFGDRNNWCDDDDTQMGSNNIPFNLKWIGMKYGVRSTQKVNRYFTQNGKECFSFKLERKCWPDPEILLGRINLNIFYN